MILTAFAVYRHAITLTLATLIYTAIRWRNLDTTLGAVFQSELQIIKIYCLAVSVSAAAYVSATPKAGSTSYKIFNSVGSSLI